ncbi:hypothetical protein SS50377_21983 [Spironucleus salmonicida]|uniref:Uncharacterized protein n=1 Tax=Spironucleus salmonicida TaxID=348837 RepID=V6LTJ8_9EUKA|nr:hypothetical protein SS50377_21983 [Spironucleus salmonicida]|eukprot:EST47021.1 Hypothetical protein SS50377_12977 [Spironucleus salmonicida]
MFPRQGALTGCRRYTPAPQTWNVTGYSTHKDIDIRNCLGGKHCRDGYAQCRAKAHQANFCATNSIVFQTMPLTQLSASQLVIAKPVPRSPQYIDTMFKQEQFRPYKATMRSQNKNESITNKKVFNKFNTILCIIIKYPFQNQQYQIRTRKSISKNQQQYYQQFNK